VREIKLAIASAFERT